MASQMELVSCPPECRVIPYYESGLKWNLQMKSLVSDKSSTSFRVIQRRAQPDRTSKAAAWWHLEWGHRGLGFQICPVSLSALWLPQSNWSKPRWSIYRRQHSGVRQIHTNEQLSLSHLWLIWVLISKGWKEEAQQQRDGPPFCWTPSGSVARQTLSLVGGSIPGTWFLWRHTPCRAFYHFSSASLLTWAAGPVNLGGETMWGGGRWQSS